MKFEFDGKEYELKYSIQRIEMIENITDMPTIASMQKNSGMFSISHLKTYFGYAVKEYGSDVFQPPKKGMEMAEALLQREGYLNVTAMVLEALERDCPFFFQNG